MPAGAVGSEASACQWRIAPSPNAGSGDNALAAVDAISSTDIWAVGNSLSGATRSTLVEQLLDVTIRAAGARERDDRARPRGSPR